MKILYKTGSNIKIEHWSKHYLPCHFCDSQVNYAVVDMKTIANMLISCIISVWIYVLFLETLIVVFIYKPLIAIGLTFIIYYIIFYLLERYDKKQKRIR